MPYVDDYDKRNKIISIRLKESTLKKIDEYRKKRNEKALWKTKARNYYNVGYDGYLSRSDVILEALLHKSRITFIGRHTSERLLGDESNEY